MLTSSKNEKARRYLHDSLTIIIIIISEFDCVVILSNSSVLYYILHHTSSILSLSTLPSFPPLPSTIITLLIPFIIPPSTCLLTHLLTWPLIYLFTHLLTYLLTYLYTTQPPPSPLLFFYTPPPPGARSYKCPCPPFFNYQSAHLSIYLSLSHSLTLDLPLAFFNA